MARVLNIWNSLNWYMQLSGLFIVELIKLPHSTFYVFLSHISYSNQWKFGIMCLTAGFWLQAVDQNSNFKLGKGVWNSSQDWGNNVLQNLEMDRKEKAIAIVYFILFPTVPTETYRKLISSCLRFLICQMGLISFAWNIWEMSIFKIKSQTSAIQYFF